MQPDTLLTSVFRLSEFQKKALKRLRLETVQDLLFHFPTRYTTVADIKFIKDLRKGDHAILYGKISELDAKKTFRKSITMAEALFTDDTDSIQVIWFSQPYIAKMLKDGEVIKLEGKVGERNGHMYISNPEFEKIPEIPIKVGDTLWGGSGEEWSLPIYPETRGISSKWIYHAIRKVIKSGVLDKMTDPLPEHIREKYSLPCLKTALIWIHTPKKISDASTAKKRFSFEEIFYIQLSKQLSRHTLEQEPSYIISPSEKDIQEFIRKFPFPLTNAQSNAIHDIIHDMSRPSVMSRLLEGDVGSGKTAVAVTTAYAVAITSSPNSRDAYLQVAYMAPTEILAKQHFESFTEYFKSYNLTIGLITSSSCKISAYPHDKAESDISKSEFLRQVQKGNVSIIIGTHALIQSSLQFKDLGLVIIDEQHRFGINQRKQLREKSASHIMPHLLSMSATPIPRTLALTIHGDLNLSILDEMPKGRKQIITKLISPDRREFIYTEIKKRLDEGRQLYVICPRIDEPDPAKEQVLNAKSVIEETKRLQKEVFKNYRIGTLHGKMKPKEKEEMMQRFANNSFDILVATSVIEVGVNVPNATMIIIEGADRFGLSQLHQLRGRVIRGTHQPYCYLFTDSSSKTTKDRIIALEKAANGFELAEYDLALRGPGELSGIRQSGISDIAMEALKNIKMVEAARKEAQRIVENDPTLSLHQQVKLHLENYSSEIHLE